jgi:lipopolysaccharide/colanic/teichoic acid biosynthesis glycosyltransferase
MLISYLSQGFPIFYSQNRVGKNGAEFKIIKFRTMIRNAENVGQKYTIPGDSRVTKIGKFMRKFSIDEIPQLVNVLIGNMSIVGIRPGVKDDYSEDDYKNGLFSLKPGITGYAQINGRSNLTKEKKREWEFKYIKDVSFLVDLIIIFKTVFVVLTKKGINSERR